MDSVITSDRYTLYRGDCLEILPGLEAGSVDAIVTDLPYGTTACHWDTVIPFAPMWAGVKHVLKQRGVFVTTASQPFTSLLVCSNLEWFKYCWVWNKSRPFGFFHAQNKPLNTYEDIVIFSLGSVNHDSVSSNRMTYNPQLKAGKPYKKFSYKGTRAGNHDLDRPSNHDIWQINDGFRFPADIVSFSNGNIDSIHPTQKPIALMEYLIRTYTNPGDTVLDICAGSGSTGVAAMRTGRRFIGIEKYPLPGIPIDEQTNPHYFQTAHERIANAAGEYMTTAKERATGQLALWDMVADG